MRLAACVGGLGQPVTMCNDFSGAIQTRSRPRTRPARERTMATQTKRGLDDGHAPPNSKRRAPDPYEYERICDLPDALECFSDPRARADRTSCTIGCCLLSGPELAGSQVRPSRPRQAACCATGAPRTSGSRQSLWCCRRTLRSTTTKSWTRRRCSNSRHCCRSSRRRPSKPCLPSRAVSRTTPRASPRPPSALTRPAH